MNRDNASAHAPSPAEAQPAPLEGTTQSEEPVASRGSDIHAHSVSENTATRLDREPPGTRPVGRRYALITVGVLALGGLLIGGISLAGSLGGDRSPVVGVQSSSESIGPGGGSGGSDPVSSPSIEGGSAGAGGETVALRDLASNTTCADPLSDARVILAYDSAAFRSPGADGTAAVLTGVLDDLASTCGEIHASDVARRVSLGAGATQEVRAAAEAFADDRVSFDPPSDALGYRYIDTPSKNLSCELSEDGVGCSILNREYDAAEDCPDRLFSAVVTGGVASVACGTEWLGEPGIVFHELQYGQTTVYANVACTVETSGMLCWDMRTGSAIFLSRTSYAVQNGH